jgi:hypothetical protein
MKIEMYQFEVMEAISYYAKNKLGLDLRPDDVHTHISLRNTATVSMCVMKKAMRFWTTTQSIGCNIT